jgi:murein DD-endopeptidase MepM/ murein hydrolase activator NlpD
MEPRGMTTLVPVAKLAVLIAMAACFAQLAEAYRPTRRHPVSSPLSLDVHPTPEIEAQVAEEVAKARRILDDLDTDNLLASPYLVSAIYYHDGFLSGFPVDRSSADPERRIIGQISSMLSPERKARFMRLLHEVWTGSDPVGPERSAVPVAYSASGGGRRSHQFAIDLFAPEGAAVYAVSRGMVVLADRDWSQASLFSTTSRKGGNAVIVFDPDHDRFYRYCHMSTVQVSAGELVAAGQMVGSVGHSGLNASQPGHGHHLHFETNEYLEGHVRAIDYRGLRTMLRQWRSSSEARDSSESTQNRTKIPSPQALSKR